MDVRADDWMERLSPADRAAALALKQKALQRCRGRGCGDHVGEFYCLCGQNLTCERAVMCQSGEPHAVCRDCLVRKCDDCGCLVCNQCMQSNWSPVSLRDTTCDRCAS